MRHYKYLVKNIGLLTLSNFATKLLSFFLVPLYTNVLTTTEYGINDLFNTTVYLIVPILTLNIQDSVMRFSIDNKLSRKSIVSTAIRFFLFSNIVVALGLAVNYIFAFSMIARKYTVFFFLMYFTQSLSGILIAYTRGIDHIADLSISSVISSVVSITGNILFLIVFKLGLVGYFIANIIGPVVQCVYLLFRTHALKEIDWHSKFTSEKKEMLSYCKPLIANNLSWWINNVSDKYVVIWFCGLAANGVYSMANKIPSILNVCQTIFSQAWTLSAVKDFDPEDKDGFFSNIYAMYNCLLTIMCSAIIVADKILAKILYAKDFYVAWKYVPWLTIAIIFGSLSGFIGGIFSAVKATKIFATSTIVGAVTNIVLNLLFTPIIGPLGAAIATTICYFVVWMYRYIQTKKYITLKIRLGRDIAAYIILLLQSVILFFVETTKLYIIEGALFVFLVVLYIKDIGFVIMRIVKFIKGKRAV